MRLALLLLLAGVLGSPAAFAQPPAKATLQDLAWISGQWVGSGEDRSEEIWAQPHGDSMVGVWRLVSGGKSKVFEVLAIVQNAEGPVFQLRHFTRDFVAWEDKDAPLLLPLKQLRKGEAVFEGVGSDGKPLRLTYRQPGPAALSVLLEHGERRNLFEFRRAADLAR